MVVLVVCCWTYGVVRLRDELGGVEFRVGVVQPNVDKYSRLKSDNAALLLDVHLSLSRELNSCDIIVWPETSIPVSIEKNATLMRKLSALAREKNVYLLIGAFGEEKGKIYNSTLFP